ncbi:MAG: ArsR/SmtB family transcription factor [Acidimicrobiales bacterium]
MDEARRAAAGPFTTMSRPAVSQHLRVLTDAGLIDVRADGNRRLYRWRPDGLRHAAAFIEEMWRDRLSRLKSAAEREGRTPRTSAS